MKISFIDLEAQQKRIKTKIINAIKLVLKKNQYILGPEVEILEKALSQFSGAKYSITCGNGTDAILLSLMALNVGKGDIVLCPSFSFAATAEVVPLVGAKPMFVDVDYNTFNIDLKSLSRCIKYLKSKKLNVVGLISVDLFGMPADYDKIKKITQKNGLWLISDAAQSFGAKYKNVSTCIQADITTTSFFPSKPLGCYGDGGAIFTSNKELAEKILSLRIHGKGKDKYDNEKIGLNSRLDTIQAAILLEKLKIFPNEIILRQRIAKKYNKALKRYYDVPIINDQFKSVWAQYTLKINDTRYRKKLIEFLKTKKIPSMVYYPKPIHLQKAYLEYLRDPKGLLSSEELSTKVLSLPMHPYLGDREQNYIINCLLEAKEKNKFKP